MTCCKTLSRRTTLKIRNTDDRLVTLLDVTKISTNARMTMTRSSLFLQDQKHRSDAAKRKNSQFCTAA